MYAEAINVLATGGRRSSGQALAEVMALAGTGRGQLASDLALSRGRSAPERWRRRAALAVAPFRPDAALDLMARCDDPLAAALLEHAGLDDAARSLADRWREAGSADAAFLLASMAAKAGDRDAHEALVNQALAMFGLEPVRRRVASAPLSVLNIDGAAGRVDGPLVSVVMAVRDVEAYIDAAVGSVLGQTWRNLELIVVDDASTDGTAGRVEDHAQRDRRVVLIRRPRSGGTYRARNAGLSAARGKLVTFHDGDDWSHPRRLEIQAASLCDEPDLVANTSRWVRVAEDGRFVCRQVWPLIRWNPSSVMVRRSEVLGEIGFFDEVLTGADSEYWARIRLTFGAHRAPVLKQPLSFGAWRCDSLINAPATGFGADHWNPDRLAYWEAWHFWHARVFAEGRVARLMPAGPRPFPRPAAIEAPSGL